METLVQVAGLKKYFPIKSGLFKRIEGWIRAVDGVDFEIPKNRVVGLVGESGSGKSTVGRTILRLLEPTEGSIFFDGEDISKIGKARLKRLRAKMQMIYQDPHASLNPRMRVGTIIKRTLDIHTQKTSNEKRERVMELLGLMGLLPDHYNRFPHELSGGQQQRVGIARALAADPQFVVMDEPTSSLDVSVQAQILNLLRKLQRDFHLTCLFISHDMRGISHICDRIAVMYAGKIVEIADREALFSDPKHPYTEVLLSSIPEIGRKRIRERVILKGDVPNPAAPPSGCRFHPRCPRKTEGCDTVVPELVSVGLNHLSACLREVKRVV